MIIGLRFLETRLAPYSTARQKLVLPKTRAGQVCQDTERSKQKSVRKGAKFREFVFTDIFPALCFN